MQKVSNIDKAMQHLELPESSVDRQAPIPFVKFLELASKQPTVLIRNVFQFFHDMVNAYTGEGVDEYPDDPESIRYVNYDTHELFVKNSDHPFFADRLFANRLIKQVESMRQGAQ
ncbi:MAG: serine protein kinase PrkA, partial [Desulfobacteraceae bacterium]